MGSLALDALYVCEECRKHLPNHKVEFVTSTERSCLVCLGLFAPTVVDDLHGAIAKALEPYRQSNNCWSRKHAPPTLYLPGDLLYRFHLVAGDAAAAPSYRLALKQREQGLLEACLDRFEFPTSMANHKPCIDAEEQGSLGLYVIVTPAEGVVRPVEYEPLPRTRKRRAQDEASQGGDPRRNLEVRLHAKRIRVWGLNHAMAGMGKAIDAGLATRLRGHVLPSHALEFHVAVWRRPFYVRGLYTKTRRDVSQTPFYVSDNGQRRKLGSTSVEEEILPSMVRQCGGISTLNNDPDDDNLLFGMAKFHASGREDMDVRMLLPEPSLLSDNKRTKITGRPFVLEIVDAFRIPPVDSLATVVRDINQTSAGESDLASDERSYGKNPAGVGISSNLHFVASAVFKGLQAEAEEKVKYYGCLCWSKQAFESAEALRTKLVGFPLKLAQKTPLRVLHRRSSAIRERHVLSCYVKRIDEHYFRLHISTDAGTYVKEFVHGDLGRTKPSVASLLGCKADILELDCEGVELQP